MPGVGPLHQCDRVFLKSDYIISDPNILDWTDRKDYLLSAPASRVHHKNLNHVFLGLVLLCEINFPQTRFKTCQDCHKISECLDGGLSKRTCNLLNTLLFVPLTSALSDPRSAKNGFQLLSHSQMFHCKKTPQDTEHPVRHSRQLARLLFPDVSLKDIVSQFLSRQTHVLLSSEKKQTIVVAQTRQTV